MKWARTKRWALAAIVLLAPVSIYLGWAALTRWRARAYAAEAVSALTYCLMGPVDDPSSASRRLRAVSIGGDLADDATWPGRCEPYIRSSDKALTRLHARQTKACGGRCCAGDTSCGQLDELRAEVRRARPYLVIGDRSAFHADTLVGLARDLSLLTGGPEGAPEPPREARLLDHGAMRPLHEGDYLRLLTDPAGGVAVSLLFYEQDRRYGMCTLDLGGAPNARCGALPTKIPVGLAGELLSAEPGAPKRMYAQGKEGDGWVEALYDLQSGDEISRVVDRPSGGFVWKNGTVAHLETGAPAKLHRVRNGIAEEPVVLAMGAAVSTGPRLIWDEVVWSEPLEDGRHRVLARRALADEEALGPLAYLGLTPPLKQAPSVEVCRTDTILALLVGANDAKGGVDAVLIFRDASGWQTPAEIHLDSTQFGLTCRDDTATLSWIVGVEELPDLTFLGEAETEADLPVGGRYSVHRLRCGGGDCKHDHAEIPLRRFSRTSRYVAGDAGDAMVVIWRSSLGDVRMKVAPLFELAEAPARSVFDDVEHEGFGWDLERDPIIGRAGNVLVLLSRQIGTSADSATYGFLVRDDGELAPIEVERDDML